MWELEAIHKKKKREQSIMSTQRSSSFHNLKALILFFLIVGCISQWGVFVTKRGFPMANAQGLQVPSDLWLGLLYPPSGASSSVLDALRIAVDVVNNSTASIYQPFLSRGFKIQWHLNETVRPQTPEESAISMRDLFFSNNLTVGGIGPGLSSHARIVSPQAGSILQRPIVCYSSTAHSLGIAEDHPFFTRTIPSDSLQAAAMLDFIYVHEFSRVGSIGSDDEYGRQGVSEMVEIGKTKDVFLLASATFPSGNVQEIRDGLQKLKNHGVTTVVCFTLLFNDIMLVLENAKDMDMLNGEYVWILSDTLSDSLIVDDNRNITGLTSAQLELVQGLIYVKRDPGTFTKRRVFVEEWKSRNLTLPISTYAFFAYDIIGLYARAAANLIRSQKDVFNGTLLMEEILKSDFLGASGRIKFDKDHDRIGVAYELNNLRGSKEHMVSFWDTETGLTSFSLDITFPGNEKYKQPDEGGLRLEVKDGGPKRWNPIPFNGQPPPSRDSHGVAVHEDRNLLIIFAGYVESKERNVNDLWTFSFKDALWTRIYPMSPQSPTPRQEFINWVIDDFYYIFGGFDGRFYLSDMWRFNLRTQQWQQVPTPVSVPSSRRASRSVLHNRSLYIFGGEDQEEVQDDVWIYNVDSNQWTEIEPSSNSPLGPSRADSCLTFHDNRLVVAGGAFLRENFNDLWSFDLGTRVWKKEVTQNAPSVRNDMLCAKLGDYLYYGAGINPALEELNDFYRIKLDFSQPMTWETIFEEIPEGHKKRDATYAAVFDNLIVWYGGSGEGGSHSDLFIYDVYEKLLEKIHDSMYVPTPRSSHISAVIGNEIVVWGGIDETGHVLNSMEQFNIDTDEWSPIVPSGPVPPARYNTLAVPIGDRIYMFFGQSNRNTFFEDVWVYSYIFNEWSEVEIQGDLKPSPRSRTTGQPFANDSLIVIYGGSNAQNLFDEVWLFDLQTNEWRIFPAGGESPGTFVNSADSEINDEEIFYIFGGSDAAGDSDPFGFILDFNTGNWTKFATSMARTSATISTISNDTLLVFAGSNVNVLYNDLFLGKHKSDGSIDFKMMDVSNSLNVPAKRDGHTGEFFGNEYFIFGGYGPVVGPTPFRSEAVIFSDMFSLRYGSLCQNGSLDGNCILCSPGTFQFRQSCISCPKGYYNDDYDFECDPCPPGFYSQIEGSDTILMCSPCSFGTYNDEPGQEKCKTCPDSKYCPIGTINPLDIPEVQLQKIGTPESQQPIPWQGKEYRNLILNVSTFGSMIVVSVVAFLLLFCVSKTKYGGKGLMFLDFFFTKAHEPDPNHRVMIYKTKFGGLFTVICLLFLIAFCITTVIPAIDDNFEESRSLIPNLTIKKTPVTSNFRIVIELAGYQAECAVGESNTCAPRIFSRPNSLFIPPNAQSVTCEETNIRTTRGNLDRACRVTYQCIDCYFDNSNIAGVEFEFLEPNTYSYEIQYLISTSAGYPNQQSSIKGYVRSDENTFLRGTATPTILFLEAIQTTYSVLSLNTTYTGFHLDFQRISVGSEVDSRLFNYRNGLRFKTQFERSSSSLEVDLREKLGYPGIVMTIIGGLSGVIGIMGVIMFQVESVDKKITDMLKSPIQVKEVEMKDVENQNENNSTTKPKDGNDPEK